MNNKIPSRAVPVLRDAFQHLDKGWTDEDYKACYLSYCEILGETVPVHQYEEAVNLIGGKTHRTRATTFIVDGGGEAIKESLRNRLERLHKEMVGEHLIA
jgi:hypothetical protein